MSIIFWLYICNEWTRKHQSPHISEIKFIVQSISVAHTHSTQNYTVWILRDCLVLTNFQIIFFFFFSSAFSPDLICLYFVTVTVELLPSATIKLKEFDDRGNVFRHSQRSRAICPLLKIYFQLNDAFNATHFIHFWFFVLAFCAKMCCHFYWEEEISLLFYLYLVDIVVVRRRRRCRRRSN